MLFRQVPFMYPDAIVLGVANTVSGQVKLNPAADYRSVYSVWPALRMQQL